VTVHTVPYSLDAAGSGNDTLLVTATCGAGQKAVGGGFQSDGQVYNLDTFATAGDDGWSIFLVNPDDTAGATGTVDAMCLGRVERRCSRDPPGPPQGAGRREL
jgi:hypothetical protein